MKKLIKYIKNNMPNIKVYNNYNMQNKHTYHIYCIAKWYVEVNNIKDTVELLKLLDTFNIQCIILGGGSNVIFKEKIISKIIIHLVDGEIKILPNNRLSVFAGLTIGKLLKFCLNNNFGGLEWSAGIPSSIGGATIMNMGAFNNQFSESVFSVIYYYKGQVYKKKANASLFGYRSSLFKVLKCVVLEVELIITPCSANDIKRKITQHLNLKRQKQPITEYSCGSVFKNPSNNIIVAKIISECFPFGYKWGGAEISTKHSNFIINKGNATFQDVTHIIRYIKKVVQKQYNICIFCEVMIQ